MARRSTGSFRTSRSIGDGMVHAIDKPGLGAEIDFELIKRKQVAVLS